MATIALVDDDKNILASVTMLLEQEGYHVRSYTDGASALTALSATPPDLAILDIKMPRMDGLEVLQAIRADPALKATPVVMLTSSREEQDVVRSYELGVNAYVVKPVKFTEFVTAVKHIGVLWALLNELPPEKGTSDGPAD